MTPASFDPFSYLIPGLKASEDDLDRSLSHSHCGQEVCDHPQYFCIAHGRIIESGRINEHHSSSVECEFIGELNLVCT